MNNSIRRRPGYDNYYYLRGKAYKLLKNYKNALSDYAKTLEYNADRIDAVIESSSLFGKHTKIEDIWKSEVAMGDNFDRFFYLR